MAGLFARFREPLISQLFSGRRVELEHDVEAKLTLLDSPHEPVGRLWESRWSNGLGSFRLKLNTVPQGHDGTARMYCDGVLVAGVDFTGHRLDYKWVGKRTEETPSFEPGQQVKIQVGRMIVGGTVARS